MGRVSQIRSVIEFDILIECPMRGLEADAKAIDAAVTNDEG